MTYIVLMLLFVGLSWSANGQNSSPTSRVSELEKIEVKVFPNPVIDHFTLEVNTKIKFLSINNIVGKEVKRIRVNEDQSYRVSDLKKGMYIVRLFNEKDIMIKAIRLSKA